MIWVFSRKKDAESDVSFSLMCWRPADDPCKVVVQGELSLSGTGRGGKWQGGEKFYLSQVAKEATDHRICLADLTNASYAPPLSAAPAPHGRSVAGNL